MEIELAISCAHIGSNVPEPMVVLPHKRSETEAYYQIDLRRFGLEGLALIRVTVAGAASERPHRQESKVRKATRQQVVQVLDEAVRALQSLRKAALLKPEARTRAATLTAPAFVADMESTKRELVKRALEANNGNRTKAAVSLGLSVRTVRNLVKKYGLDVFWPPPPVG